MMMMMRMRTNIVDKAFLNAPKYIIDFFINLMGQINTITVDAGKSMSVIVDIEDRDHIKLCDELIDLADALQV